MIQILIHSSKTMRIPDTPKKPHGSPLLIDRADKLADQYRRTSLTKLTKLMGVSTVKAADVEKMYAQWSVDPDMQIPAIDAFVGDIYSGLQVQAWSGKDREYAQKHLLILSGLYGALRACDGIMPYRLEMAYKLPNGKSLYDFWAKDIAGTIPTETSTLINLSAVEYTKAVLPYVDVIVITPKFLTINSDTGEPTFVTVHTKIARGAFAGWLIRNRIDDVSGLKEFSELNYHYDAAVSTLEQPVFVCKDFGGIGLSVRLAK